MRTLNIGDQKFSMTNVPEQVEDILVALADEVNGLKQKIDKLKGCPALGIMGNNPIKFPSKCPGYVGSSQPAEPWKSDCGPGPDHV